MNYRFHINRGATKDLNEISAWYEEQETGLSEQFEKALRDCFAKILLDPLWPRFHTNREVRRWRMLNWPYSIFYRMRGDQVRIVAIIHTSRDPKYLNYRLR